MSADAVWLIYRAHRNILRLVETVCVLSDTIDPEPVLLHPLIRDHKWERIGATAYHAYDAVWEYKLERWAIDDSMVKTNWIST